MKVCGKNIFCQLGEKGNNKSKMLNFSIISPYIDSYFDSFSISSISSLIEHTIIITTNGEIYAAGYNRCGKIIGTIRKGVFNKFTKFEIKDSEGHQYYPISAVCGYTYTLYLVSASKESRKNSLVYCSHGQKSNFPLFLNIGQSNPVSLFGGARFSAAITEDGSIIFIPKKYKNFSNQLFAFRLPSNENAVSIAILSYLFLAVDTCGRIYTCEIDSNTITIDNHLRQDLSLEGVQIVDINGCSNHCLAISEDGRVFARGVNSEGQLGIGKEVERTDSFVEVKALSDYKIKKVYAGYNHSFFQTEEGKILTCGSNECGQLIGFDLDQEIFYFPVETIIKSGAKFCIAGISLSIILTGADPIMSPNQKVTYKKVPSIRSTVMSIPMPIQEPQKNKEKKQTKTEIESTFIDFSLLNSSEDSNGEENFFIDDDDERKFYINKGKIGEGATSITYKLVDKRTKGLICKKVIKFQNGFDTTKTLQRAINEFKVLYEIDHPCICKALYINLCESIKIEPNKEITTVSLFLEYLDHRLDEVLKTKITNTLKTKIVLEIVHAMNFIHKNGMMHRDIKIENIMLNSLFETKIVDFGLVKFSETLFDGLSFVRNSLSKGVGTLSYMSPEMANEKEYDNKTDIYSFGVVLHFMFVGFLPKQSLGDKLKGKKIDLPKPSNSISQFCIKLISLCLSNLPSKRPSFEEILMQLRKNAYKLAPDVDSTLLSDRDQEIEMIENSE